MTERRIGQLMTAIQHAFLETPALSLSSDEAEGRFGIDAATRAALFAVLTDARVLATNSRGAYVRVPGHSRPIAA